MIKGPCLSGQLFIASQCVCNSNLTMHYYEEKQECYQLYTQGPCSKGQMMTFNYHTRKPQCVCRDEHVLNHDGNCYQVNTVGPCNQTACPQVSSFLYSFLYFLFYILYPIQCSNTPISHSMPQYPIQWSRFLHISTFKFSFTLPPLVIIEHCHIRNFMAVLFANRFRHQLSATPHTVLIR